MATSHQIPYPNFPIILWSFSRACSFGRRGCRLRIGLNRPRFAGGNELCIEEPNLFYYTSYYFFRNNSSSIQSFPRSNLLPICCPGTKCCQCNIQERASELIIGQCCSNCFFCSLYFICIFNGTGTPTSINYFGSIDLCIRTHNHNYHYHIWILINNNCQHCISPECSNTMMPNNSCFRCSLSLFLRISGHLMTWIMSLWSLNLKYYDFGYHFYLEAQNRRQMLNL